MDQSERKQLQLEPLPGYAKEVGLALAAMQEARQRTKEALAGLKPAALAWTPPGWPNSIGTLLYHLALVEADWLYVEILERDFPAEVAALFPQEMRDEAGLLSMVEGISLEAHLARLDQVRAFLLDALRTFDAAEWVRVRSLPAYDVTPVWIVHHLMQHEADHRGQIQLLRILAEHAQR